MSADAASLLPADIRQVATRIAKQHAVMHACLRALRDLAARDEAVRNLVIEATVESALMASEIQRLKSYLSAAKSCGLMEPEVTAQALELHPVNMLPARPLAPPPPVPDVAMRRANMLHEGEGEP